MTCMQQQIPIAVTGQDCPRTGLWRALGPAAQPLLVRQGEIMPGVGGRVVSWELVQAHADEPCPAVSG